MLPMELVRRLEGASYRFAVSMPGIPHYYTMGDTWESREVFEATVRMMRGHERAGWWRKAPRGYLWANGFRYWTMGAPVVETILINRAPARYPVGEFYSGLAPGYDVLFEAPADVREARAMYRLLGRIKPTDRVLDIGCGTGALVDFRYRSLDPERYMGIDTSYGMLGEFVAKHPPYAGSMARIAFEDFEVEAKFDIIAAMFGVASYLDPEGLEERVMHYLAPGGRAVLTYYHGGQPPRCYERSHCLPGVRMVSAPAEDPDQPFERYRVLTLPANAEG